MTGNKELTANNHVNLISYQIELSFKTKGALIYLTDHLGGYKQKNSPLQTDTDN